VVGDRLGALVLDDLVLAAHVAQDCTQVRPARQLA
jgi:hypothetical protein